MTSGQVYDVIVVGAGPAGSTAARRCTEQGLKTILIEKERIPRPKLCAGMVSAKAINLIPREIPRQLNEGYVQGFRLFSPTLKSIEIASQEPLGMSVSRDRFDAFLVGLALDSGCTFHDSDALVDVTTQKQGVVCQLKSGSFVRGQMVIGADGVAGIVAGKTGIRNNWQKDQIGLCLESRIPATRNDLRRIGKVYELYLIDIPLGYGWVLPKRSSISLGIGGCLAYLKRPQELLASFCQTVSKLKGLKLKFSGFGAHLIPAGGFERKLFSERSILVGDAAGFVDSLSGEGIYYAMKSGLLAADACKKAIDQNDTSPSFLAKHYSADCNKEFGKDLKNALDLTYRIHANYDLFVDVLDSTADSIWIDLARGETTYSALKRKLLPRMMNKLISRKVKSLFRKKGD